MTRHVVDVVITAPGGKWIRTNQHTHWRSNATLVKAWRTAATAEALKLRPHVIPSPFTLTATIHKKTRGLYDLDGVVPTIKAAVDGCRTAGLIVEDDFRHMARLTVEPGHVDPVPFLHLRFEES